LRVSCTSACAVVRVRVWLTIVWHATAASSMRPTTRSTPSACTSKWKGSRTHHRTRTTARARVDAGLVASEAKRALQGVSQGASQVIHQQPGERNEVNYFCEVLPEQTLVNVDQVHGITLYLEEGSTLVRHLTLYYYHYYYL